ncbi:Hsp70 family protein [Anaeromyxobacter diazotrophicus]|uniref:Heat-shock protein n=1 Tax=Anaeromyxobacter diazotrophicus TaxID=2590199 RepID=A0A7I9VP46_9BACT|nr:Hsp70 family protein [Anaeromyxobacter diazotrophicus]GEJ58191.1 heat-shock protein [Anaeromyxobacter diazotrophicus]
MSATPSRFLVGIDLGTIHTALAYVDLAAEGDPAEALRVLAVPQLVAPGEVGERRLLPSSAYLPGEHELPPGARRLPWGEPDVVVGELARAQGARVPGRLVASAKSWLSHPRVDRTAAILPWGAPEGVPRLSPVAASALYLGHLRDAWAWSFPEHPLPEQEVVLTVPASFDEVARELTLRAAREAGLDRVTLLEEPQAAFYDFATRHRADLAGALGGRRLVLVCDVGGGTTDLTLIHAAPGEGAAPRLTRLAVGDHLLLGGDNVDVTLARQVEARLGARLDAVQWSLLVQACREAKERLLSPGGGRRAPALPFRETGGGEGRAAAEGAPPEALTIAIPGRGSRLVGGTLSAELTRPEVLAVLLDGFFPRTGPDELPRQRGRGGLLELGLPYEAEPAVTRHALAFLRDHAEEVAAATGRAAALPRPDALLLNGGVFTPPAVRERLREVVSSWFPGAPPVDLLDAEALDLAVARGAAAFALVRRGLGLRIGGGAPRAYYVGVDTAGEQAQAICLVPRHAEEGAEIEVPRTFALRLDQPVRFPLYATTRARFERPGDAVAVEGAGLQPLPPVETVLRSDVAGGPGGARPGAPAHLPVRLRAALTEIGTLEVFCVAEDRDARWKLEFGLRGGAGDEAPSEVAALPRRFEEARELVDRCYGKKAAPVDRREVKGLARALEKALGPREQWGLPLLRELWAALHAGMARRRRSADHERQWLTLTGYALRPGFGAPLDAWRAARTFAAFGEGLQFQAEPHNWQAWWILWRRIAGGLDEAAQERVLEAVLPFLAPPDPRRAKPKVAGVRPEAVDEMVRLAASLERVAPARKRAAGEAVLERLDREGPAPHLLWAVGRLGARVPFHGSGHACVAPEVAEAWLARLLAVPARPADLVFPVAQLARMSGDRARDLAPEARDEALAALRRAGASPALLRTVEEPVALEVADEQRVFGESLPAGLVLL